MSFYGSIYYQLVDALHRIKVRNAGLEETKFPIEEKIPVAETEIIYRAPGRQGTFNLDTGNRWLTFTKEGYKKKDEETGEDQDNGITDSDKPYILWHNSPDGENCVPLHGFKFLKDMYFVRLDEELGEETFEEAVQRVIPPEAWVKGCRAVFESVQVIENEDQEDGDDISPFAENEDGEEINPDNIFIKYVLYELNEDGEWFEVTDEDYIIRILTPDDFFIATEDATVDKAGHILTTTPVYYKMPKSDVQEEIDKLKERMDDNEALDEEQEELIQKHEKAIGEWSDYCGAIYDSTDREEDQWIPTISKAIGPIGLLIDGTEFTTGAYVEWYKNPEISITRAIGSLTDLVLSYKSVDGVSDSIEEISLVDILIALKDKIIAPLNTQVGIQGALLERHEEDITDVIKPAITDLQNDVAELFGSVEDLEIIHNEDVQELEKADERNLQSAKAYTDNLANGAVKDNKNAIDVINHETTGIYARAQIYTDNLANGAVKDNKNAIDAINHETTGILAQSKIYTDGLTKTNADAILAINDAENGILKKANDYADSAIDDLNYTDNATEGQYVYSVNEENGFISVEHKALPTYTLTSGETIGTVAFNGTDVPVKGLGSAAYADTSAFDPANSAATAKTEAIAAAKTETEGQIAALSAEGGAIQVNAKAISDLQDLLKDYATLIAKVDDLERRIIALEPPVDPEIDPEPTEPETGEDPETT